MSRGYSSVRKAERAFVGQSDAVDKALCLATVHIVLGEDIVIALEKLNQLLPSGLAGLTRSYVEAVKANISQSLFEV